MAYDPETRMTPTSVSKTGHCGGVFEHLAVELENELMKGFV
jgi:hypothetical protein